ncbi:MAG: DNA-directed RNA polymerase subunit alpha [Candidatus Lindowbacteria bacterium]|nr:DNA-directed RNA polymerase subunit alpha [Candidatus Lindowbacteria bacterium]
MDVRLITRGLERPKRIEFKEAEVTATYGKFVARPLEKGFGVTLGNALRRVLLSTIPGAAISSATIDGVAHEFSVIPGVMEDVTDIILNLKQIHLKIKGSGKRELKLTATGPGEVRAKDIVLPEDVVIMNPEQVIATIDQPDAILNMTMVAQVGRGYASREEVIANTGAADSSDQTIGVIQIDALFSPVLKVAYSVESTRVRQRTDYDSLIIEITTDGSVDPEEALGYAARILNDYLKIFVSFDDTTEEEESPESKEDERLKKLFLTPVDELELSVRSANCLKAANLKTLGELVIRTDQEMLKYRNFGKKSLLEIKDKLGDYELALGMKDKAHLVPQIAK